MPLKNKNKSFCIPNWLQSAVKVAIFTSQIH